MRRVYLDHNATSPLDPEVRRAIEPWLGARYGNPSSPHWEGREAAAALTAARRAVARRFGGRPSGTVFTSGATEALNAVIRGVADVRETPPHLVISAAEHPAVIEPCRWLAGTGRADLSVVAVDAAGRPDPQALVEALRPDTALVCLMRANNEVGTCTDTSALAAEVRKVAEDALVLVDFVQAAPWDPATIDDTGADALVVSGHKMGATRGIGALIWARSAPALPPLLRGGPQEAGRRAGTENVPGVVAMATACGLPIEPEPVRTRRDHLAQAILGGVPTARVRGDLDGGLPNTFSVTVPGLDAEQALIDLDANGISASSGSACATGTKDPSHVLLAMGLSPEEAWSTLRFSLGRHTSDEEIEHAARTIPTLLISLIR